MTKFDMNMFFKRIGGAIGMALISVIFILIVERNLYSESKSTILEVNRQIENKISLDIKSNFDELEYINRYINEIDGMYPREKVIKTINNINNGALFKYIGIADKDGYINTGNGKKGIYVGDRRYFKKSIRGEKYVTDVLDSRSGYGLEVCYSVPLIIKGKVEGVLVGVESKDELEKDLNEKVFLNKEKIYVICSNGDVIIEPHEKSDAFELHKKEIVSNIQKNNGETIKTIRIDGDLNMYAYKYIANSEHWYVVSIANLDKLFTGTQNTIKISISIIILSLIFYIIVGFYKDVQNEKRVDNASKIDYLTNLNRIRKFKEDARKLICSKPEKTKYAILSFDIKNFRAINKLFGYKSGDEILSVLGKNIKEIEFENVSARVGEDIFTVLFEIEDEEDLDNRINYIRKFVIKDLSKEKTLDLKLSIGVYIFNGYDDIEIKKFLDNANLSRIEFKKLNEIPYYLYNDDLKFRVEQKLIVERSLKESLKNNEFKLLYQPKVDVETEKIVGIEALIRWKHKEYGYISPDSFIPIAEKNGDINLIGKWVIEEVCKTIKEINDNNEDIVPVAINLSRVELYQSDLIFFINDMMKKYSITPELLEFEITETATINDMDFINKRISEIKKLGVRVSMDDFGTGSSTLNNLKLLDIDTLKIDRSISIDIETNERTKKLIESVIKLAKDYNFEVVCEGIENMNQVSILKDLKCDIIQGYVYYKPLELENLKKTLFNQFNRQ